MSRFGSFYIGRSFLTAALFGFAVLHVGPASADEGPEFTELGEIVVSASLDRYEPFLRVEPFVPFEFYVLVRIDFADLGRPELNGTYRMTGFEGAYAWDPGLWLLGTIYEGWVFGECDGYDNRRICYYGMNLQADFVDYVPVIRFVGMLTEPLENLYVTLEPIDLYYYLPGYIAPVWYGQPLPQDACPSERFITPDLCRFTFATVGNLVLNCTDEPACRAVSNETTSWGTLRSRY